MAKVTLKYDRKGKWGNCAILSNGSIELVATLDFGPRVIHFGFIGGENEFFEDLSDELSEKGDQFKVFGDKGGWHIYGGSRLWTSPEEMPRTYYPDNEKVKCTPVTNGIKLLPPPQSWNNQQMEVTYTLDAAKDVAYSEYKITNIGLWEQEFAPWVLTVMAAGGKEVVPMPQRKTGFLHNRAMSLWSYTKMNDKRVYWGDKYITLSQDKNYDGAFKFGIDGEHGYAAYFNHDNLFIKYYTPVQGGNYPDNGMSFETYTNPHMLEIETLGELKKVKPGEAVTHAERWELFANVKKPSNDEKEIEEVLNLYLKEA